MKNILLLSLPFVIVSLYANTKKVTPDRVVVPKVVPSKVYIDSPKCPSDVMLVNAVSAVGEILPYKHCIKCVMGALLGDEGQERCTYCGEGE